MNLFKILASGDGSINEPNVSAFLGYLLNPNADHGIRDELLKKVLRTLYKNNQQSTLKNFLIDKHHDLRDLSINSNFEINVLLEQAFKSDGTNKSKQIVDIVILCFEKNNSKKESLAKAVLSNNNKGELKQIFLIENKIRDEASKEQQLKDQCNATIETLSKLLNKNEGEIKNLLSIIFISPEGENSDKEYLELEKDTTNDIPKCHLYWSEEDEDTINAFLKEILISEAEGNSEPINEFTKHTLKSFIAFVENDFKSTIEEELEGKVVRDITYNFGEFKEKYHDQFNPSLWEILDKFQKIIKEKYSNLNIRHSRTHPISIFLKDKGDGKKIFDLSKRGNHLKIQLVNRNYQVLLNNQNDFLKTLNEWGFDEAKIKQYGIELKSNKINYDNALKIFEKQYKLVTE